MGECPQALETAKALYEKISDPLGLGNALLEMGHFHFMRGSNDKALEDYSRALNLFEGIGNPLGQGNALLAMAKVRNFLASYHEALSDCRQARRLFGAASDGLGEANSWRQEGLIQARLFDFPAALEALEKARQGYSIYNDLLGQANAWFDEAQILLLLQGDSAAVEQALDDAEALFRQLGYRPGLANLQTVRAESRLRQGDFAAALQQFRSAREIYRHIGDALGQAKTWQGEGEILLVQEKLEDAQAAYQQAADLFGRLEARLGQGRVLLGQAWLQLMQRQWQAAVDLAMQAQQHFIAAGSVNNQVQALILQCTAFEFGKRFDEAAGSAQAAIDLYNSSRKQRIIEEHRLTFDQSISQAYDTLVLIKARQGRTAEVLALSEESRSRTLLDTLAYGPGPSGEAAEGKHDLDALLKRNSQLQAEITGIETELSRAASPARKKELERQRQRLDVGLDRIHFDLAASSGASLGEAQPLDAEALAELAQNPPDGPVLYYHLADADIIAVLISPQLARPLLKVMRWPFDLPDATFEMSRQVENLLSSFGNPLLEAKGGHLSQGLWGIYIEPFAEHIPAGGPLTIVPHGLLHQMPFEALRDPQGNYLSQRWAVSIAPSLSALQRLRERHRPSAAQDTLVAASGGQGLLEPALESIAGLFDPQQTRLLKRLDFEAYRQWAPQARQLLIASRGFHEAQSRRENYLEIEASQGHDSRLSAAEISAIPLQAELVTLAACDTSFGRALFSDDRLDLARAFLSAGAASLLATRWKLPDTAATFHFLEDFFRAYRRGGPSGQGMRKDEALNLARKKSRERGDPAQVWAAWVLMGHAR